MASRTGIKAQKTKDLNIETLRGLAIIALVAFHVIGVSAYTGLNVPEGSIWRWFADSLGFIRMPLFTFLSGVVYAMYAPMRTGVAGFVKSKARRLIYPMITVGAVFLVLQTLAPGTNRDLLNEEPWYLWLVLPVAHFWFLPALLWIFVIFAMLDVRRMLDSKKHLLLLLLISVVLSMVLGPLFNRNWLGVEGTLYLLPFFTFGVTAARLHWQDQRGRWKLLSFLALIVGFIWIQLGISGLVPEIGARHDVIGILTSLVALLAVYAFRFQNRTLAWLGQFAYPIFLFHVFGSAAARIGLEKLGVSNTSIHFFTGLLLALVLGYAADRIFSRFKITNVLVLGNKRGKNTRRS